MSRIIQVASGQNQSSGARLLLSALGKACLSDREYAKLSPTAFSTQLTDLGPGILLTAAYSLSGATEAGQTLATITPGFVGRVASTFAIVTTAASTASKTALVQPYVDQVPGTNQVNTIGTTGTPTGGTFTITVNGVTSAAIAFNAAAATIQTALTNMANIAVGDVVAAGGALPTAVTLTWANAYAGQVVTVSVDGALLTGGTTPTATNTVTTAGAVGNDTFAPRAINGGLITLTTAGVTPASKVVPGTPIASRSDFSATGTIAFRTSAAPTAFVEGAVIFGVLVNPQYKPGAAVV